MDNKTFYMFKLVLRGMELPQVGFEILTSQQIFYLPHGMNVPLGGIHTKGKYLTASAPLLQSKDSLKCG